MALIRHSQRTVKCTRCGRRDFYWYHDEHATGSRPCEDHPGVTHWVLLHADDETLRHAKSGRGKCEDTAYVPADPPEDGADHSAEDERQGDTDDDGQGFRDRVESDASLAEVRRVLGTLVGASTDPAEVRAIAETVFTEQGETLERLINERLADISAPTVVVVNDRKSGDERKLEGLQHSVLPTVLRAMDAGVSVWMTGPAGTGKSTIARQAAEALGLPFGAISLSPNTSVSEVVGYRDANGVYQDTGFRRAYEDGHVFLFDEVDNGHPSTLAKINMALANGHMAFPDGMVARHPDFRAVAAANTHGTGPNRTYVGRLQIDGATLDRFATVSVPVDETLEHAAAHGQGANTADVDKLITLVRKCRANADEHGMPLIFSPRACIEGARLLAAGFDFDDVVAMRVRKGASDQDWAKVSG